jgi:hypothetical protein
LLKGLPPVDGVMIAVTLSFFQKLKAAARFALRKPRSALLLVRMGFWVALISLLVRVFTLERALKLITPLTRASMPENPLEVQARISSLVDLLLSADVWFVTPTCWKRAPLLYRYLALSGIETCVVFGVRKGDANTLDGHAWLEFEGRPLLEKTTPDYKVTFCYPS